MTFSGIVKSGGAVSLLILLAVALSGCGRRSDLEVPVTPAPASAADATASTSTSGAKNGAQSKSTRNIVAPKRDFLLDPLL